MVIRHEERETQYFYADCFYFVSSQTNQRAVPVAHKVVLPRPALNLDSLVRRQKLNSLLFLKSQNPQPTLPVRDVTHIPWSQFSSGIFILTFLNDTSSLRAREHLRPCLHLTNPCTEWKVLILTKPKGKIYKTKSLHHYITDIYIYIYIYIYNVCVHTQPLCTCRKLHKVSFLAEYSWVEFKDLLLRVCFLIKIKEPSMSYHLPNTGGKKKTRVYAFPKSICIKWNPKQLRPGFELK